MSETVVDDGRCFACGHDNPHGIGLRFTMTGPGAVAARIVLDPKFQGYAGIAHGGIVMTLLDEGMAHAAGAAGVLGVTASIDIRFRAPVPLGDELLVRGTVNWQRRGVLDIEASVLDARTEGSAAPLVFATASGRFVARGSVEPGALGRKAVVQRLAGAAEGIVDV